MTSEATPNQTPNDNKLRKNSIGLALLTFMVISAAAPLTGIAGAMPLAMLLGNGAGVPGTFVLMAAVLLVWAVGFVTLARHIKNAGAFYAYSSRALGGRVGGAVSMIALVAYNAMMIGLLGLFGGIASSLFAGFGLSLPWWVWALVATALVGILGFRQVELSAKVLFFLVSLECLVILIVDFTILKAGGAGVMTYNIFDPKLIFSGSFAAAILFVFGSFIGIEATAIYAEEVRDPGRTVPRATYLSIILIAAFYVLTTWLMVVGTGRDQVVAEIGKLPDPTAYFFELAGRYGGGTLASIMGILLVSSIFASVSAMHNFIARYTYVAGREGLLPAFTGVTHSIHKSPHVGSLVQTVLAILGVVLFAVLHLDPILNLFTWIAQVSVLGVLTMMSITSFAVIAFFRKYPLESSTFKTVVAPLLSGLVMAGLAVFVFVTFGPGTGTSAPLSIALPSLIPLAGLIGYAIAGRLAIRDPRRFEQLGSNDWAHTDPVAKPA